MFQLSGFYLMLRVRAEVLSTGSPGALIGTPWQSHDGRIGPAGGPCMMRAMAFFMSGNHHTYTQVTHVISSHGRKQSDSSNLLKKTCPAHVPLRARFDLAFSPAQTFVRRQSGRGHLPSVASGGWARSGVLLGLELPSEARYLSLNTNMCA